MELAVKAADVLTAEGKKVRVVSMPSTNRFDKQDAAYRESVLPASRNQNVLQSKQVLQTSGINTSALKVAW